MTGKKVVAMLRTTERPKYFEISLKSVLETMSTDTVLLVLSNTGKQEFIDANKEVFNRLVFNTPTQVEPPVNFNIMDGLVIYYKQINKLVGGPGVINKGVEAAKELFPDCKYFIVLDDDVILAPPVDGEHWDQALIRMLDAGWDFVGHPCTSSPYEDEAAKKVVGGVTGIIRNHLCGATSAFKIKSWEKVGGVPSIDRVFGYCPEFQHSVSFKHPPAYFGEHSGFLTQDFDDHSHPLSLRLKDYFGWYRHMRPGKAAILADLRENVKE